MKFYEKDKELQILKDIQEKADKRAQMAIIFGRKGVGKTKLVLQATEDVPTLYFLVSRKAEPLLCSDFLDEMRRVLDMRIDEEIIDFRSLFKLIIVTSEQRRFNLIMDEVQEYAAVNNKIFNDIQSIWYRNVERSKLCMFLIGNEQTIMRKVFEGKHAPLGECADTILEMTPYSTTQLKAILAEHCPNYTKEDLLAVYSFTKGVPEYVEWLIERNAFTAKEIIDLFCDKNSPFINEGKSILIDQVGKEYTFYFSILSCIANNITARSSIESILNKEIGGYLTRMESDFRLIRKQSPLFAKSGSKNVRYFIEDNFFKFWFRYIYANGAILAQHRYDLLKELVEKDYENYSALCLHSYFQQKLTEENQHTLIGGWWDHNEDTKIDLIAINKDSQTGIIASITKNASDVNISVLTQSAAVLQKDLEEYDISYHALSIEDM